MAYGGKTYGGATYGGSTYGGSTYGGNTYGASAEKKKKKEKERKKTKATSGKRGKSSSYMGKSKPEKPSLRGKGKIDYKPVKSKPETSGGGLTVYKRGKARAAKGGSSLGTRKAMAADGSGLKNPRSAQWKNDSNPNAASNNAGGIGKVKAHSVSKSENKSGVKPSKPNRKPRMFGKRSPTKEMKRKRKKSGFNFGKAIRRGFGQLS